MELLLEREYEPGGTNGILSCDEQFLCFTIELPWRNNRRMHSCIPEGLYPLVLRYSTRHRLHLILIHKANNALKELKGCIAPVAELLAPGIGRDSVMAFKCLMNTVQLAFDKGEQVWLRITKLSDRYSSEKK